MTGGFRVRVFHETSTLPSAGSVDRASGKPGFVNTFIDGDSVEQLDVSQADTLIEYSVLDASLSTV